MRELSYVSAFFAGLILLTAAASWFKILRNPKNDLIAGRGGKPDTPRLKSAAMLTAVALGLSGVAMILAVLDWFLRVMKVQ